MGTCMHWRYVHEFTADRVVRTCTQCGASGSRPRCSGTTQAGRRCRKWVDDDGGTCRYHTPEAAVSRVSR